MKETLEMLWNARFEEKCALIRTKEEKLLAKKVAATHRTAVRSLTAEQSELVEEYVEALHEMEHYFLKRAFFDGCEFAVSFLLEAGKFQKG